MRSKKQKRAVEKSSSKQKDLEKTVSSLRGQLTRTEKALTKAKNRADRWRKEAKAQKRSASRARARVEKLNQKLDAASAAREPVQAAAPMDVIGFGSTGGRAHDRRWCHGARRDVERRPVAGRGSRPRIDRHVEQDESATPRRAVLSLAPPTAEVVECVVERDPGRTPGPACHANTLCLASFGRLLGERCPPLSMSRRRRCQMPAARTVAQAGAPGSRPRPGAAGRSRPLSPQGRLPGPM